MKVTRFFVFIVISILMIVALPCHAQNLNISEIGTFDFSTDRITDMARVGDYAYVIGGDYDYVLYYYDLSDLASPELLSETPIINAPNFSHVRGLRVFEERLFVIMYNYVILYDIENPVLPVELSRVYSVDYILGVEACSADLYVLASSILYHWDISNPDYPLLQHSLAQSDAWRFHLNDNFLYIWLGSANYSVYDVSNPESMAYVGTYSLSGTAYMARFFAHYVSVVDFSQLFIYDVSQPAQAEVICALPLGNDYFAPLDIFTKDGLLYLVFEQDYYYERRLAYQIYDFSDPSAPVLMVDQHDIPINRIYSDSSGLILVDEGSYFYFFDLDGEELSPNLVCGAFSLTAANDTQAFVLVGQTELRGYDLANPAAGAVAAIPVYGISAMGVSGNLLATAHASYLEFENEFYGHTLRIWDVSNPIMWNSLSAVPFSGRHSIANDLQIFGDRLILAKGSDGLDVFDISNPHSPTLCYSLPGYPDLFRAAWLEGPYLYAALTSNGNPQTHRIRIYDISSGVPQLFSSISMNYAVKAFQKRANRIYAMGDTSALRVYDISNPAQPYLAESLLYDSEPPLDLLIHNNSLVLLFEDHLAIYKPSGAMNRPPLGRHEIAGSYYTRMALSTDKAIISTPRNVKLYDCADAYELTSRPGTEPITPAVPQLSVSPNPFRASAEISFEVSKSSHTVIKVYNLKGQLLRVLHDAPLLPGQHSVNWNGLDDKGRECPAGIYLMRFEAEGFKQVKRMVRM